jgi:hypothetical protein
MITLIITLVVVSAAWLAFEVYRAPIACEGPDGLCVLEPGRQLGLSLSFLWDRVSPLAMWGVV